MKDEVVVRRITALETRPLRQVVLRPHQRQEELFFAGDDVSDTAHFGAFVEEKLVGIASICREPPPESNADATSWRLRGMAVSRAFRSRGIGSVLLRACIEHARGQGASMVWCNARTPAVPFYRRHGFETRGKEFELPKIGPHYFMRADADRLITQ